ncbi:transketolase [Simkania negevensis]|uniref:Transketolase n=1 Tax=Simkania negevensis TaxID=83561 RepID=A0ABS3AR33_9BACT|nr:transketolase [Simkania negevensis]
MQQDIEKLIDKSHWLRNALYDMVMTKRLGHVPSCFSMVESIVALFYRGYLKHDPKNPKWEGRDRLFISKGHAAISIYPILVDLGIVAAEELDRYTKPDGLLRMYADPSIPTVEAICGSLGHGFSIACGHALSAKKDNKKNRSFVILGDGECYEGSVWETAMFAAHHKLDNLITIVDKNKLCIMGETEELMALDPLEEKWRAFGWNAISIDGHKYSELLPTLDTAVYAANGKPTAIIAHTTKGKGISFMENQPLWHNKMPTPEQDKQAREELCTNPITC